MMKTAKTLTALLACALLLAACGGESKDPKNTEENTGTPTGTETEEERYYPALPEGTNFNGDEFRILGFSGAYSDGDDFIQEESSADVIRNAVYERNLAIEQKLNIEITCNSQDQTTQLLQQSVMSGDNEYDLVFTTGYEFGAAVISGLFAELKENLNVEWTAPWYDQNCINDLSVDGMLYGVTTDISKQQNNETSVLFYNKEIAKQYDITDLYSLVNDGKWTIDKLVEYARIAAKDVDNDGFVGSDADIYGIVGNCGMSYITYVGAGGRYISSGDDGVQFRLEDEANINRMIETIQKFSDRTYAENDHASGAPSKGSGGLFNDGQAFFQFFGLGRIHGMRDVEFDFGILPVPKWNEEQERYYNNVNIWGNSFMGLPKTVEDLDKVSVIVDQLAAESYYTVRRAYFEVAIRDKYARDSESVQMLDLVFDNRVYDMSIIYNIGNVTGIFEKLFNSGSTDVSSAISSNKVSIKNAITNFVNNFYTMSEQ